LERSPDALEEALQAAFDPLEGLHSDKGQKTENQAYVANISRGGIGLYISKSLPVGREATVTLRFVNQEGKEIEETVHGKILWQREAFAAGISLKRLRKKDSPAIVTFLEAIEKSPE